MASMSFRAVKLLPLISSGRSAAGAASASARTRNGCRAAFGHALLWLRGAERRLLRRTAGDECWTLCLHEGPAVRLWTPPIAMLPG